VQERIHNDPNFEASISSRELAQGEFNSLMRDLDLFKKQTELLAFRSKDWNHLLRGTRVSYIRNHHESFNFLSQDGNLVYYKKSVL
jgi:hypothetical protein